MAEQIVREDVKKLIQAPSAYAEVVAAGKRYLEAVGTVDEAAAREALVGEPKEDVCGVDGLTTFVFSLDGETVFDKEVTAATKTATETVKTNGEPNYLCDACQTGMRILRGAGEV